MKRIFNERYVVFSAALFVVGMIIAAYFAEIYLSFYLLLGALAVFIVVCFFVKPLKKFRLPFIILTLFLLFGFLYTRYKIFLYESDSVFNGLTATVLGTVSDVKTFDNGSKRLILESVKIDGVKAFGKISVYLGECDFTLGDEVKVFGKIKFHEYSVYGYANSLTMEISAEQIVLVSKPKNVFYVVSNFLKSNILRNVSGDEGGIMVGLFLGDTTYMTESALSRYRLSGISHIFAVSGLHIVFFSSIISKVLSLIKLKGFKNTIVSAVLSVFYAGLCGFPVSALRAVIMSTTLNLIKNAGRKYDFLNSIFLSLIVVLLIFPETLFTYGLILSYAAVIGIALFNRVFERIFSFLPDAVSSSLSVSAAVTYFMTPILFLAWGYSSVIVIFLNLLLVPIVSVLYSLVFASSLIYCLLPFFDFIWNIPFVVAHFINSALDELNVIYFTYYGTISVLSVILYYACAFAVTERTNFKLPVKFIFIGLSFIILLLAIWGVI